MHPLGFYRLREMKTFDGLCYVCVCVRARAKWGEDVHDRCVRMEGPGGPLAP